MQTLSFGFEPALTNEQKQKQEELLKNFIKVPDNMKRHNPINDLIKERAKSMFTGEGAD